MNSFFNTLCEDQLATECFEEVKLKLPSLKLEKLNRNLIGVKIAYWDENVTRPKAPFLSEIDFYEDKFRYFEADPKTQALTLVLEESYEDAMKQLKADTKRKNP